MYMESSGKNQDMSDFQGLIPIRTRNDDYSCTYSQRYTWSGDQGALSRFSSQNPPNSIKIEPNDIPELHLDHLQPPHIKPELSAAKQGPNIKQEPYEYSASKEVTNEYSRAKYQLSEFPAIRVQADEFPTVNIRDLGSNVLQLSNADRFSSEYSEISHSQYLQNNLHMPLPLREPLVDITNALASLDGGFSNGSTLNGQTNPSKAPLSQYLPVLRESDFNSQGIHSTDEKSIPNKYLEGQEKPKVKKPRNLRRPVKSAQRMDPNFRGATVTLHTEIKDKNCSLTLSAHFSNVNVYKHHTYRKRKHSGSYSNADSVSGSDEENTNPFPKNSYYSGKICASCGTHRTPLWRDADDGTPLCNACGIRFKKYRIRCSACWHIPKKDIKTYPKCPLCGASLRVSLAKRHPW